MASLLKNTLTITICFIISSSMLHPSNGAFSEDVSKSMKRTEKTTHLHFFFHDVPSGKNSSSLKIAGTPDASLFGNTYIIDSLLTEGQNASSKAVGKAQGLYAYAAKVEAALLMVVNYEFTHGEFNGSSISVLGRNLVTDDSREMPIVGGTGQFRYANGYALAHTVLYDKKTGYSIIEYNVYGFDSSSNDISKNHQVRKKYTIQLGENELVLKELDLLNDDANVYKLIGPVLVKQDLAEANANVRKRIEYISAELKRLDSTLQDLEEKQNSKKEAIYVKSKEAPAKDVLKGLVEMCQMFHKSAEISSQILVLNMKGGLYLSGRCRCLSDTNAKPENYKSILEGVKENFLKVARVVWDRESKVIENNAFRDGDTVMDAVEFLLQNFSETNKLWVRMELQGVKEKIECGFNSSPSTSTSQNTNIHQMASSSNASRELQKELEAKANDLSKIQKDISKNHQVRKKYTIQLGENELVLKELDLLNDDANVYKLIGPVLVKQDLAEANANVRKRIEYISAELKRLDSTLQDLEEKQNSKKEAHTRNV
ncbi:hypothetical protein QVD17_15310 [Tagetes erecta]|uniref:Dirigent protein n=1 Tax=Tagetes erecta TaxID=13708 RepID=A0AAD8NYJ0_TARER|nr:hypothetical protein QVD17_15310 [Tagetes erecta]